MVRSTRSVPLPQVSLPARKRQRTISAPVASTPPSVVAPVAATASQSTATFTFTTISTVHPSTTTDTRPLETVLNAANIDLDSPSPDDNVDLRDTNTAELGIFGDSLIPPPAQHSVGSASHRSATLAAPGAPTVPDRITIVLHYRIGAPLQQTRPRKNLPDPSPIFYSWGDDSYGVLYSKIRRKVEDISAIANVEWKSGSHPYLRPHSTATANQYLSLDSHNCNSCLRKAWIKEFRRKSNQDIVCSVYIYLQEKNIFPTESAIIQQQTTARLAPSNAPIAVPSINTFRQMGHHEQLAASLRQRQEQVAEVEQQVWKTVSIRVAGLVWQIEISGKELRDAMELPE